MATNPLEAVAESDLPAAASPHEGNASLGSRYLDHFVERRDQQAFEEIVRLYGHLVYGVCRRVVQSHHDAEDAFQATFLVLSQKAASIRNRRVLASWLYQVAYQVSLRTKTAMQKRHAKEQTLAGIHEPVAAEANIWPDLEPILDQELNRLAEKYRAPILLCDLGCCTIKDAAKELGWSQGTLSTRLTKARSILAERLTRHGFTLSAGGLAILIAQNAASAAVPTSLVASTAQAATLYAGGKTAVAGVVSSKATTLANGVVKSIVLAKIKIVMAALLAVATVGVGLASPLLFAPAVTTHVLFADGQPVAARLNTLSTDYAVEYTVQVEQGPWQSSSTEVGKYLYDAANHRLLISRSSTSTSAGQTWITESLFNAEMHLNVTWRDSNPPAAPIDPEDRRSQEKHVSGYPNPSLTQQMFFLGLVPFSVPTGHFVMGKTGYQIEDLLQRMEKEGKIPVKAAGTVEFVEDGFRVEVTRDSEFNNRISKLNWSCVDLKAAPADPAYTTAGNFAVEQFEKVADLWLPVKFTSEITRNAGVFKLPAGLRIGNSTQTQVPIKTIRSKVTLSNPNVNTALAPQLFTTSAKNGDEVRNHDDRNTRYLLMDNKIIVQDKLPVPALPIDAPQQPKSRSFVYLIANVAVFFCLALILWIRERSRKRHQ